MSATRRVFTLGARLSTVTADGQIGSVARWHLSAGNCERNGAENRSVLAKPSASVDMWSPSRQRGDSCTARWRRRRVLMMSDVQVLTGPVYLAAIFPGQFSRNHQRRLTCWVRPIIALTVTRTGDVDVWFRWGLAQGHASDLVDPVATIFYKFTFKYRFKVSSNSFKLLLKLVTQLQAI